MKTISYVQICALALVWCVLLQQCLAEETGVAEQDDKRGRLGAGYWKRGRLSAGYWKRGRLGKGYWGNGDKRAAKRSEDEEEDEGDEENDDDYDRYSWIDYYIDNNNNDNSGSMKRGRLNPSRWW
ncbi:uncharacterized protein LOC142358353 [Convolutriloba macropyga]|uniref:uncharacterized protein LOC142358353 n=1 Tax=Convolutriloba macropyga TaxID=536237 RepID=UPI003F520758